jgi:hypothetical protein
MIPKSGLQNSNGPRGVSIDAVGRLLHFTIAA